MNDPYRVLFVCMGNICRSPAGEGVFAHVVEEAGLSGRIICDSAGTISYHSGDPADRRMSAAAAKRGIVLTSRARQIQPDDLRTFDLVLTMDEENFRNVCALAQDADETAKIRRFCEFCRNFPDKEVPDPYYGGARGFEHVLDLLEDGSVQLLEHIQREIARAS